MTDTFEVDADIAVARTLPARVYSDLVSLRPGIEIARVAEPMTARLAGLQYAVETYPSSVLQLGIAKPGEPAFARPAGHRDHGRAVAAYYWWIFPTTMFNVYPWGISVNVVTPLAVDRMRVSFLPYVWDEAKRETGVHHFHRLLAEAMR